MNPDAQRHLVERIVGADVGSTDLRTLGARDRRYALYHLLDRESASLAELADVLAGWEAAAGDRVTTADDRDRCRVALYHSSLPRLADAAFVRFDRDEATVERGPRFVDVRDVLEAAYRAEAWSDSPE